MKVPAPDLTVQKTAGFGPGSPHDLGVPRAVPIASSGAEARGIQARVAG